jgi:PAS domain S-box-containing protein
MTFVGQSLGVPWFRQEHGQGFMAPLGALLLLGLAATLAVWHWGGGRRGVRPIVWALTALLSGVCVAFGSRGLWGHAPFLTWEDWLLTGAAKRAGYAMSYLSPVAAALGLIGAAMLVAVTTRRGRQGALGAICVGLATALAGFGLVSAMGRVAGLPLVTSLGRPLSLGSGVAMSLLMLALALEGGLRRWLLIGFLGSEPGAVGRDQVVPRLLPVAAVRLLWIIAGLALAGSQLVLHNLGRGAWEDQEDLMSSVLDLTAERIANWRAERLGDARTLIRVPYLARALTELNTRPEAARQLTEFFREFRRAYGYATVDVYDRDLQPVLRLPAERRTERPAGVLEELRGAQDPVFHDLEADAEGGLRLGLAVPIRHAEGGDFAGAVYLGIDPAVSLFRILELWRGRSDSTDAVLVRKAGDGIEYLSPFRFQAVEKLPLRLDYSASGRLAVRLLQEGATDLIEGQDYRGVAVLGVGRPVPGSPWFVLAKVDRDDALRHARMTAWAVGGGFLAVVGSLGWTVGRYWRGRQRDAELRRQRLEREKSMVEERLGALMRSANDVVLLYNEDMRVVDANERVRDLYGRSPQEMIGLPAHDLRATGSTSGLQADFLAAYSQGGRVYETLHHRRDGTEFPVEVSARPVTLEGRRYLLSIVRDISERRLRDLEIHRLNRMYFVISQVNQAIVHQGSEAELFAEVVRVMVELGEFRLAWIGRVDEATRRIDPVAVAGDEHGYVAGLQVSADPAVPAGQGPTGTAVRENRAVIVNNFFDDPSTMPWRERASRADFLSCASFPVRVEGRVAGVLAVYAAQREFFGAREIALLEEAAGDVGFALRVFARDAERRRAQEALREREEIFSSIVGHAMDAMVVFDQAGRVVEFNRAAHEMLGYTREEFARFSIRDFNAQQDEQEIQGHIGRLMQTGRLEFETLHQHKDGSTRTVQVRASVLQIRGASYISGAWTDITRQKRAEAELRASEERHRALYESMDIGVVYQDAAGAITAANHAAQLILGLTLDQMQGRTSLDADWGTCREDGTAYPGHEHPAMVALRTGMRINGVIMGIRSGAGAGLRWLSVDAVPETRPGEGRPYRVFTLFTDITQRLRTEEEMRQLSAAVEQNPASVVITDLSGAIQYVNPRFTEFTGYSLAEVKGRNPRVLKSGLTPPETYQDLWRTIAGGRVWRGELVNRKKNGEIFTELVVITPVRDAYGNLHRYPRAQGGHHRAQTDGGASARQRKPLPADRRKHRGHHLALQPRGESLRIHQPVGPAAAGNDGRGGDGQPADGFADPGVGRGSRAHPAGAAGGVCGRRAGGPGAHLPARLPAQGRLGLPRRGHHHPDRRRAGPAGQDDRRHARRHRAAAPGTGPARKGSPPAPHPDGGAAGDDPRGARRAGPAPEPQFRTAVRLPGGGAAGRRGLVPPGVS